MLEGLKEPESDLQNKNIGLYLIPGNAPQIHKFLDERGAGFLVTDFDPLRFKQQRLKTLLNLIRISAQRRCP